MVELLFLLPMGCGLLAFFLPVKGGRALLVLTGLLHLLGSGLVWLGLALPRFPEYFSLNPAGLLVLTVISFLFLPIACYAVAYLGETEMHNEPVFHGCMLFFLAAMSMVALADHLIVLWVAVEATTLASAPLIFMHKTKEALEATWKYVLICSVGIALALLGAFCITLAMDMGRVEVALSYSALTVVAGQLNKVWLKAGFIFVLIGYGTKMGLAPMHTWLPDAHSESPSPASAMLSGALLNCAFLGIYKTHLLLQAAGLGDYSRQVLVAFGLLSMLVAAIFILNQTDYKRLLAYSSIENMGIIAVGVGLGRIATYGAFLHLIHHSLLKSSLFLSSGNLLLGYGTKAINRVGNMARLFPKTFTTFFGAFAGISGFPPFGIFISELLIIMGAFRGGHYLAGAMFLLCLLLVFGGAARLAMRISFAKSEGEILLPESLSRVVPPFILLLASLLLTFWLPERLYQTMVEAIIVIGGSIHG